MTASHSLPPAQAFEAARRCHLEGALAQARALYRRVLAAVPDHVESQVMLASLAFREGDEAAGQAGLRLAIDLARDAHRRLGGAQPPGRDALGASLANLLLAGGETAAAEALLGHIEIPLNPARGDAAELERRRRDAVARGLPSMLLSTLPKSASESIWNKLAEGLGLAQCHVSLGLFPDCSLVESRLRAVARGGFILKEHLAPTAHNLRLLAAHGFDRLVVHLRDPRQATLSWVHFVRDDVNKRLMAPIWRKIVPPKAVLEGELASQLDWALEAYLPLLTSFLEAWTEVETRASPKVLFMSFEAFLEDPAAYYETVLGLHGIPSGAFRHDAAAEVVHLRQGRRDEWRDVLTEAQRERAWQLIPPALAERFGWRP